MASDRPGPSDRLMLWISNPVISTADEAAGPKLNLADEASSDEEVDQKDDNGAVSALAKEFKGQRWTRINRPGSKPGVRSHRRIGGAARGQAIPRADAGLMHPAMQSRI